MKISERWLREWVDPALDAAQIGEVLTAAGLEVDAIAPAAPPCAGVVVGEIIDVQPHPQADRLTVCQVLDGVAARQVVCGAPNARPGLKTAYAGPGAELPGLGRIELSTIRGTDSAGMLCSAAELGLGDDASGILELSGASVPGSDLRQCLDLDDAVIDVDLTPNRGDCFCVLGIARDLAALTGVALKPVEVAAVPAAGNERFAVTLQDPDACPHYAGRVISGVDVSARTPLWLQERLRRAGLRSIHPLVDVTNYVMLELGQPMHAFDLDRLDRGIVVRPARAGERLTLLDAQDLELADGVLVIADHATPVALAGVMGGQSTAVGAATVNVFLESAFFEPVRLAGVARRYRLQTDASTRFERGVDPTMQVRAIERATRLILDICGGRPGPCTSTGAAAEPRPLVGLRPAAISRLLGMDIAAATVERILQNLDMQVVRSGAGWQVRPPAFRFDISREADLIEEVARIHGYAAIPLRLPRTAAQPALAMPAAGIEQTARHGLSARGYFEAITYSFIDPDLATLFCPDSKPLLLANPISSEMSVMRGSLLPGLVNAARHNLNRQLDAVRLFEIGMVFADTAAGRRQNIRIGGLRCGPVAGPRWDEPSRVSDFFDVKQDVEALLKSLAQVGTRSVPSARPALHPGQSADIVCGTAVVGWLGALHPAIAKQLDLPNHLFLFEIECDALAVPGASQYQPISRFPSVRRDLSVVLDEQVAAADCLKAVREVAGDSLRDLQLFDVYRGQGIDSGKKSLALGLIFQARSSTLRDDEVDQAVKRVLACLSERFGGSLRD